MDGSVNLVMTGYASICIPHVDMECIRANRTEVGVRKAT